MPIFGLKSNTFEYFWNQDFFEFAPDGKHWKLGKIESFEFSNFFPNLKLSHMIGINRFNSFMTEAVII